MALWLCFTSLLITTFAQSTIYVNIKANSGGNGQSWNTAFNDLQGALKIAQKGNEIWIAQGTYYPTNDNDRNITFSISDDYNIYGGFIGSEKTINQRPNPLAPTILSGNIADQSINTDNSYHVMSFTGSITLIDGLIISDGYATNDSISDYGCATCFGGGLWMPDQKFGFQLTLNQMTFSDNTALSGGAVFGLYQSSVIIKNSLFTNNRAIFGEFKGGYGGGFFLGDLSNVSVINTTFSDNTADGGGGGAHCDYGVICDFYECIFDGNVVTKGNGGAISVIDRDSQRGYSDLNVTQCTFKNNKASSGYGAGVYLFDDNVWGIVNDSIFTDNSAAKGGAMSFYGNSHCNGCCDTSAHNTFNGNTADDKQYDNCFTSTFTFLTESPITDNPLTYLSILNDQKSTITPPSDVIPPISDNTVFVNSMSSKNGDGSSWSSAFNNLQDGLDSAQDILNKNSRTTVEIWVTGSSDYKTNKYIPSKVPEWYNKSAPYYDPQLSKMFEIYPNINVFGGFGGTETKRSERDWYKYPTLLDGFITAKEQAYQVVYVHENVWIDGFMIANGYACPHGHCNFHANRKKTKSSKLGQTNPNQILFDPTPVRGSAIFSNVSYFGLANILMYSNYGTKGSFYILGNPHILHNITGWNLGLINNYATDRGGGIGVDLQGEINCIGCIFMNNVCSHKGGGVYSDFVSQSKFDQCTFYNNTAYDSGGGMGMDAGFSYVTNSNFTSNYAFCQGAGIYTGSYNPYPPGPNHKSEPNHYFLKGNTYTNNVCDSGIQQHYLWAYDYWVDLTQ